jgi:hypothetical protein
MKPPFDKAVVVRDINAANVAIFPNEFGQAIIDNHALICNLSPEVIQQFKQEFYDRLPQDVDSFLNTEITVENIKELFATKTKKKEGKA